MPTFNVGDAVVYRPYPGAVAEDGVVTGISPDSPLVFVRYRNQHPGARGKATHETHLTHLSSKDS